MRVIQPFISVKKILSKGKSKSRGKGKKSAGKSGNVNQRARNTKMLLAGRPASPMPLDESPSSMPIDMGLNS